MIRAALFDMDGLLFDTENLHNLVLARLGDEYGAPVTFEMLLDMLGTNEDACSIYLRERYPFLDTTAFWADFHRGIEEYVRANGMPIKTGAREILDALRQHGIKTALVTSSQTSDLECYMGLSGFGECFDVFVTGDMGLKSKPEPDVYLRAAEKLGVSIGDCVVLEDSLAGLTAGHRAGATTIMVPDIKPYAGPFVPVTDHVVPTLLEARDLILEKL